MLGKGILAGLLAGLILFQWGAAPVQAQKFGDSVQAVNEVIQDPDSAAIGFFKAIGDFFKKIAEVFGSIFKAIASGFAWFLELLAKIIRFGING